MVFVLLACSDICGKKVNVTLPFENPPKSLEELYRVVEQVFRGEEKEMKQSTEGGNYDSRPSEPFTCRRIQRYDDDKRAWVEITNEKQLCACDQLYVFRKNATKADISQERELPEPRNTAHFYPCDTKSGAA
uniref:Uncharacterized protein n=1 Tax=Trypanosoma congolense (strain IL3000) TaxID=1068625 RepID=F9WEQ5_TRYCI|nr:hypothetical protein, unlikely [Trypanosoma congolense IL3000]